MCYQLSALIMDLKLIIAIIMLTSMVETKTPQVYENVDETPLGTKIIEPNQKLVNFMAQKQMDQQKLRYHQQQQIDQINRFRNKYSLPKGKKLPYLRKREIQEHPQGFYPLNFGLNHADNVKLLQESFGGSQEQEFEALSALMGKPPTEQLEGLKQLLGPKDHIPIIEHTPDFANPQTHPNVKVEPAPPRYQQEAQDAQNKIKQQNLLMIAQLENELNQAAQAQAQETIAKAQQAALAEIQAQHKGLQVVRAQAIDQTEALYGHGPRLVQYKPVLFQHNVVENNHKAYGQNKDLQYASQYAFGYRVRDYHSGNNFGHEEISDGKTAKGHYHVLLPDGRMQNVQYWADETGFHAKVTYDKAAQH